MEQETGAGIKLTSAQIIASVAVALLYYDYFLTFTREVEWIWLAPHKLSWASAFFFVNRYLSFFGHMPYVYEFFSFRNDLARLPICIGLRNFRENACYVTQISVGFFLVARTYALWNKNKYILWLLIISLAAVVIYVLVIFILNHREYEDNIPGAILPYTCLFEISTASSYRLLSAWLGVLLFDALVFFISVYKVSQYARKERSPILYILLRDGIVYFAIASLACVAVVLTFWPSAINDPYSRGGAEILANCIASILASRLFLNLRDPTLAHGAQYREDSGFEFNNRAPVVTMSVALRTLDEENGT